MARLPVVVGVLAAAAVLRCAAQETTGYFLNDCPKATGADYALYEHSVNLTVGPTAG